jgi:hypothetical protein
LVIYQCRACRREATRAGLLLQMSQKRLDQSRALLCRVDTSTLRARVRETLHASANTRLAARLLRTRSAQLRAEGSRRRSYSFQLLQ